VDVLKDDEVCPRFDIKDDLVTVLEPMRMQEQATTGDELLEITSLAQRRDYDVHIGFSVGEQDEFREGSQDIQYWKIMPGLQTTASRDELYAILANRFHQGSNQSFLPSGMPETTEEIEVTMSKKGEGAFVHSARQDLTGDKLVDRPVQVKINHNWDTA
jgi:hypothetical protein